MNLHKIKQRLGGADNDCDGDNDHGCPKSGSLRQWCILGNSLWITNCLVGGGQEQNEQRSQCYSVLFYLVCLFLGGNNHVCTLINHWRGALWEGHALEEGSSCRRGYTLRLSSDSTASSWVSKYFLKEEHNQLVSMSTTIWELKCTKYLRRINEFNPNSNQ